MSIINLTQAYITNCKPSLYDRIRTSLDLDMYWASSIDSIEEHFRSEPPRKKDRWSSSPAAYVMMRELAIKRLWPDTFDEEDNASLLGLDSGLDFPSFLIEDYSMRRVAYWMAGKSAEYLDAQLEFGFNRETFVVIPKIIMIYRHDEYRGWLAIKSLDQARRPAKSLAQRIQEAVTDLKDSPIPITV